MLQAGARALAERAAATHAQAGGATSEPGSQPASQIDAEALWRDTANENSIALTLRPRGTRRRSRRCLPEGLA